MNSLLGAAFLMGLMGSGHCMAMCGGISNALGLSSAGNRMGAVLYQLGRVSTYAIAGAVLGLLGYWIPMEWGRLLRGITAVILVAVALYLMGFPQWLSPLERLGQPLWRKLSPVIRKLGTPRKAYQFWLAGLLWGWLPCGLVYSALALAASAASLASSILIMVAFGLGTLPAMLGISIASQPIALLGKRPAIRIMGGFLLLFLAGWMLTSTQLGH